MELRQSLLLGFALTVTLLYPVPRLQAQNACPVPDVWLPRTPLPPTDTPPPHPNPDCPFYRDSWQNFLYALQPGPDGRPRFLADYLTISDLFGATVQTQFTASRPQLLSLALRTIQLPNDTGSLVRGNLPGLNAGVNQAGPTRGIMIDQNGNPLYYAIHVNQAYKDFLQSNGLTTKSALTNAAPDGPEFPEGVVELKSAWQILTPAMARDNYLVTRAVVPNLKVEGGDIILDTTTRELDVRLLAIHVVFTLKGHPEFVWSTFEHINQSGLRDNAPAAKANPADTDLSKPVDSGSWTLYRAGTLASDANKPNEAQARVSAFDPNAQSFTKGGVLFTSVFRMYPASKATDTTEDDEVSAVNQSISQLFTRAQLFPSDPRSHYALVGATWLDKPMSDFGSNVFFQNASGQSSDVGMVAGEDSMSSTAMESFTQAPDAEPGCFACHNTKVVTDDRDGHRILSPKRLNVSHVLSRFLSLGQ